ncbi:MAG: phosphoribosylformylglycinamidine synthase subunit PurQ [Euryarchaeota archaeon]|nr:phosphoribosylformylglycinamidine synthase subunit PurQ [Euryarchaeota archaeon]
MKRDEMRVGVCIIEGSNSEDETAAAFRSLGTNAEVVHLKQLLHQDVPQDEERTLDDYDVFVIGGGFSGGDYIRAGAIFANRIRSSLFDDLKGFVKSGKPVLGVCNGFQVLVELGMLPDLDSQGLSERPEAVLHLNDSDRYECRPTRLKHVNRGTSKITAHIPLGEVRIVPSAHGEGRLLLHPSDPDKTVKTLADNDQIVFTYTDENGNDEVPYPYNPNGAPGGIAGITNRDGNVLGMMPHPERSFWRWQHPDWTRTGGLKKNGPEPGDGHAIFEGVVRYAEKAL